MKARREYKVPLSKRAIELLRALPHEAGGFVFIGSKGDESIGSNSMASRMTRRSRNRRSPRRGRRRS